MFFNFSGPRFVPNCDKDERVHVGPNIVAAFEYTQTQKEIV